MKSFSILLLIFSFSVMSITAQETFSWDLLDAFNKIRVENSLAPFQLNDKLNQAAEAHSADMAARQLLDHVGSDGSAFWERMQAQSYDLLDGSQSILAVSDLSSSLIIEKFLSNSGNLENLQNASFTDIGIGYVQGQNGQYYVTVLFGLSKLPEIALPTPSTPSPTPVVLSPTLVPLSATPSPSLTPIPTILTSTPFLSATPDLLSPALYAAIGARLNTALERGVMNFDTSILALTPTAIPHVDLKLIYDQDDFALINVSGDVLDLRGLKFVSSSGELAIEAWNTEFLSQRLSGFFDQDCLQVWYVSVGEQLPPPDCRTRQGWIRANDSQAFWRNSDNFLVYLNGEAVIGCEVTAGICDIDLSQRSPELIPTATPLSVSDLKLIYDQASFSLINISGRDLNLRAIRFVSPNGEMSIDAWDTGFLSYSLSKFPARDCLQTWPAGTGERVQSDECRVRQAWVGAGGSELFWQNTSQFTVFQGTKILATCFINNGSCQFKIDENQAAQVVPTSAAAPNTNIATPIPPVESVRLGSTDIRLVYSNPSFTLINTSGRDLDLSQLAFESDNGVMLASYWQSSDLSRSLSAFPSGGCVQAWPFGLDIQETPASCGTRHGWVVLSPEKVFWVKASSFRVRRGSDFLATCYVIDQICEFNLP
ncbi:hypothetical protein MASR2M15_18370 [Anaerolineales bacterium]